MNRLLLLLSLVCLSIPLGAQLNFEHIHGPAFEIPSIYRYPNTAMITDTKGHLYVRYSHGFLIHSADQGINWTAVADKSGWRFFVGWDGGVYALEGTNLHRSTDHGASWSPIATNLPAVSWSELSVDANGNMLLSGSAGLYRSTDAGANWQLIRAVNGQGKTLHFFTHPGGPDVWLAYYTIQDNKVHVHYSPDLGAQWEVLFSAVVDYYTSEDRTEFQVGPDNTFYLALGGDGNYVLRSTNGGADWETKQIVPFSPAQTENFAVFPSGELVASLSDNKWYRSTNQGASWAAFTPSWGIPFRRIWGLPDGQVFGGGYVPPHRFDPVTGEWVFIGQELCRPDQMDGNGYNLFTPYQLYFLPGVQRLALFKNGAGQRPYLYRIVF